MEPSYKWFCPIYEQHYLILDVNLKDQFETMYKDKDIKSWCSVLKTELLKLISFRNYLGPTRKLHVLHEYCDD